MAGLCHECCKFCCPCLTGKSRRSSKYDYVKYTASKQPAPSSSYSVSKKGRATAGHKGLLAEVESEVLRPEQVFEFPQRRTEHHGMHPQMFVEKEPTTVTTQPRHTEYGRFHSYSESPSTTLKDYSLGVASGKYHSLPRRGSHDPTISDIHKTHSLPRKFKGSSSSSVSEVAHDEDDRDEESGLLVMKSSSSSLPNLSLSPHHDSSAAASTNSLLRRGRRTTVPMSDTDNWVPNLPILEEMALSEDVGDATPHPFLQFSLHYDVQRYTLTVHLHHASNLPAMDRRGTSDPFIVLYMIPNKEEIFESRVIHQTLNPVFDQSFEFKKLMADDIRRQTLVLRVYDHDKFSKNDTIGGVLLPLEEADLFGVVMRMRIDQNPDLFSKVSKGDLLLALSYDPNLSALKGLLLKATNLKKQDVIGLADPYVKIRIHYQKKIVDKWKSSVKRKTLIPVFNENFEFDVAGKNIEEITMEVLVMDYDRFSKDDIVGRIHLGFGSEGEQEKRHWRDMIDSSPQVISQWHTIKSL